MHLPTDGRSGSSINNFVGASKKKNVSVHVTSGPMESVKPLTSKKSFLKNEFQ